jgi:16S rRNA processing protein RimM
MMPFEHDECIAIGAVRKPIGLHGWVGVSAFGKSISAMKPPYTVLLCKQKSIDGLAMTVVEVRRHPKGFRLRLAECSSRDDAERIRDHIIKAPARALPPLQDNEYYFHELEGMAVLAGDKEAVIGTVAEVHNYPSVDALEIRLHTGKTALVPLTPRAVPEINRARREVRIELSLLDEIL